MWQLHTPLQNRWFKGCLQATITYHISFGSGSNAVLGCLYTAGVYILRKPIPCCIISVKKMTALVMCLCRLHNFCIDQSDIIVDAINTPVDDLNIAVIEGGVPLEGVRNVPEQLIDGGSQFDDTTSRDLIMMYIWYSQQTNSIFGPPVNGH
jgi:hypothetical protein